jgi:hypothetical protein
MNMSTTKGKYDSTDCNHRNKSSLRSYPWVVPLVAGFGAWQYSRTRDVIHSSVRISMTPRLSVPLVVAAAAGLMLYMRKSPTPLPPCNAEYCPPAAMVIQTDPWWDTEMKDQSGGAGLSSAAPPDLRRIWEKVTSDRHISASRNAGVKLVEDSVARM